MVWERVLVIVVFNILGGIFEIKLGLRIIKFGKKLWVIIVFLLFVILLSMIVVDEILELVFIVVGIVVNFVWLWRDGNVNGWYRSFDLRVGYL